MSLKKKFVEHGQMGKQMGETTHRQYYLSKRIKGFQKELDHGRPISRLSFNVERLIL